MKIATSHFNWPGSDDFDKMLKAFLHTTTERGIETEVITLGDMETGEREHKTDNMWKARMLCAYIQEQKVGTEVMLCDCDGLLTGDPLPVFEQEFDIAITIRTKRKTINTGVLFIRVSTKVKAFFKEWLSIQERMYIDPEYMGEWYDKLKGINQAAFARARKEGLADDLNILELPCRIYNSCTDDHMSPAPNDRVFVHYHFSHLRKAIFIERERQVKRRSNKRRHQRLLDLRKLWLDQYEKAKDIDPSKYEYQLRKSSVATYLPSSVPPTDNLDESQVATLTNIPVTGG